MKKWYLSKTIWVNLALAAGIAIEAVTGAAWLDAELQAAIIVLINFILRLITKEAITK